MKKTLSNNTRYRFKGTIVDKSIRVTHGDMKKYSY